MHYISPVLIAVMLLVAQPVSAADPTDPTWPCIQRKIVRLSAGVIWPYPIPESVGALSDEEKTLASALALRRVSLEEAEQLVAGFESDSEGSQEQWTRIFSGVFGRLDKNRTRIIQGIERYAQKQLSLSADIDQLRNSMDTALSVEDPDYDKIDAYEVDLDWKTRIFDDRNRALIYVCESPVLLEKRAFAMAKLLQNQITE